MTQEDKQLLLADLCGRLPYGVKAQVTGWDEEKGEVEIPLRIYSINTDGYVYFETNDYDVNYLAVDACRLCLRPMSSMTEEERKEFVGTMIPLDYYDGYTIDTFDWLNAHHFDFRNLIERGLAISTEEYNPYKE